MPWDPALYPYVWRNESASTLYNSTAGSVIVPDPYRWLEDTTSDATQSCEYWPLSIHTWCSTKALQYHLPGNRHGVMHFIHPTMAYVNNAGSAATAELALELLELALLAV